MSVKKEFDFWKGKRAEEKITREVWKRVERTNLHDESERRGKKEHGSRIRGERCVE